MAGSQYTEDLPLSDPAPEDLVHVVQSDGAGGYNSRHITLGALLALVPATDLGSLEAAIDALEAADVALEAADVALRVRPISFFVAGVPTASEVLAIYAPVTGETVTIADELAGASVLKGVGGANPTASFVLTLHKNAGAVGTITISTAGAVTLATTGTTIELIGGTDVLTVKAPAVADATFANWAISLKGAI